MEFSSREIVERGCGRRWVQWVVLCVSVAVVSVVGGGVLAFAPNLGGLGHHRRAQVLLTGWGPFLNFSTNPSELVARRLARDGCSVEWDDALGSFELCFDVHVLPVNRSGVLRVQEELERRKKRKEEMPSAVLHLGLENVALGLRMETVGANFEANPSGGEPLGPAIPGAADILPSTADLGRMEVVGGAVWSRNAGKYFCNELLFRSLHSIRSQNLHPPHNPNILIPALFTHLPNVSESSLPHSLHTVRSIALQLLSPSLPTTPTLSSIVSSPTLPAFSPFATIGLLLLFFALAPAAIATYILGCTKTSGFYQSTEEESQSDDDERSASASFVEKLLQEQNHTLQ